MALKDITTKGLMNAVNEFNKYGPRNMQEQFGSSRSERWDVRIQYNRYDQELLLRAAHELQGLGHLKKTFTDSQAKRHLEGLNFVVVEHVQDPPVLYRSVNSDSAYKNHVQGRLYFRSYEYFRQAKGVGHDELEGIGSYTNNGATYSDISDRRPLQPAYLMCFSENVKSTRKFGTSCMKLCDPVEFAWRVQKSLPPELTSVEWWKVEYNKTKTINRDISPTEEWHRKHCCKPRKFRKEKEWRLMIQFRHTFRPFNKTLKLHIFGRLEDLFKLQP